MLSKTGQRGAARDSQFSLEILTGYDGFDNLTIGPQPYVVENDTNLLAYPQRQRQLYKLRAFHNNTQADVVLHCIMEGDTTRTPFPFRVRPGLTLHFYANVGEILPSGHSTPDGDVGVLYFKEQEVVDNESPA